MPLELRPNCECCDKDLPANATDARICSFECTFCADCVENVLHNVCPNCGGGFERRPVRPANAWRPGVSLATRPASTKRHAMRFTVEELADHIARVGGVPPEQR
jgi:hypothetical protein